MRLDLTTPNKPAGEGSGPTEEIALDVSGPPSSGVLKPPSSGKLSPKPSSKSGKEVSSKSGSKTRQRRFGQDSQRHGREHREDGQQQRV